MLSPLPLAASAESPKLSETKIRKFRLEWDTGSKPADPCGTKSLIWAGFQFWVERKSTRSHFVSPSLAFGAPTRRSCCHGDASNRQRIGRLPSERSSTSAGSSSSKTLATWMSPLKRPMRRCTRVRATTATS